MNNLQRISDSHIIVRSFQARAETVDEKARSVMAVLATETPVRIYDWESGDYMNEILLADGFEFAKQVPLLDSHARWSVKDQLGSIREMAVSDKQLVGRVFFGQTQAATEAFSMVRDNHLTDLSIGYVTASSVIVKEGNEYKHTDGRVFKGPCKLSLKTVVREGSVTPIGADEMAKFRDAAPEDGIETRHEDAVVTDIEDRVDTDQSEARCFIDVLRSAGVDGGRAWLSSLRIFGREETESAIQEHYPDFIIPSSLENIEKVCRAMACDVRETPETICITLASSFDMPRARAACQNVFPDHPWADIALGNYPEFYTLLETKREMRPKIDRDLAARLLWYDAFLHERFQTASLAARDAGEMDCLPLGGFMAENHGLLVRGFMAIRGIVLGLRQDIEAMDPGPDPEDYKSFVTEDSIPAEPTTIQEAIEYIRSARQGHANSSSGHRMWDSCWCWAYSGILAILVAAEAEEKHE